MSRDLGVQMTFDIGIYLGMPLLHKHVTRETRGKILEKVQHNFDSWTTKHLALVGRITLAKHVFASMPMYAMETTPLPSNLLCVIE